MTIFVDASALVAMLGGEDGPDGLADAMHRDHVRLCSAVSAWEAVAGLRRSYGLAIPAAETLVGQFLADFGITFVPIGQREWELATAAYARFGKGRHPAAPNMGDCFACAGATANDAMLLYQGEDVAQTDLA